VLFIGLFVVSLFVGGESKSVEKANSSALSNGNGVDVYFFYGQGCPHCGRVKPFLAEMEQKYRLKLHKFDIYNNRSCLSLFDEYSNMYGLPLGRRGVPAVFVSDTYFVGDTPILDGFEEVVKKTLVEASSADRALEVEAPKSLDTETAHVTERLNVFTVTVAALVDAISPCSIAILVFLIGARVLIQNRRKRALKVGLAFCLSVFIAYFLFGLGLFTVVQASGFSGAFSLLVGLVAVLAGIFYLKDVFWHGGGGFVMEVPRSLKPLLMKMLKGVTSPFGAFAMGFLISLFELPCTGGPYLFILGQLADSATRLQAIPLLLYYNFIFVLPLIMISLLLYSNLFSIGKVREWNERNKRLLRSIGGFAVMTLGFSVLPDSQMVQFMQLTLRCLRVIGPPVLVVIFLHSFASFAKRKNLGSRFMRIPGRGILLLSLIVVTVFIAPNLANLSTGQSSVVSATEGLEGTNRDSSLESLIADSLNSGKLVFLFFYLEGCGYCRSQKPVIDELEQEYADKIAFIRVNAEENRQAIEEFGVTGFPTMFLIVSKNEEEYSYQKFEGFADKETLKESFEYAIENGSLPIDRSIDRLESYSTLMKIENESMTVFDGEAGIKIDGNSISECSAHHSCNKLLCKGRCLWENKQVFYDLLKSAKDVVENSVDVSSKLGECALVCGGGAAIICGLGFWSCSAAVTTCGACTVSVALTPEGVGLVVVGPACGSCVVTAGGCVAGAVLCIDAVMDSDIDECMECGQELAKKINDLKNAFNDLKQNLNKAIDTIKKCSSECNQCPSSYNYLGMNCHPTEECGGQTPDHRLECSNNYVVHQTCTNCEWKEEVIEDCSPGNCGIVNGKPTCVECENDADCVHDDPCMKGRCVDNTCVFTRKECNDGDRCTMDYCEGGSCRHRPIAGCDHPDDNYDVSTQEGVWNTAFNPEADIAILRQGDAYSTQKFLADLNETSTLVDIDFPPDLMDDYPILIIPSGGLYGLDSSPSFKSNLEGYVENGGTLIAFSQQHGYEFKALPSGEVSGFGWLEDQSCHYSSVGISTYHPILSGQDSEISDVNVDGYFTKYPDNATTLLSRTKNGMPAMLMYEYGNGRVIATTAYTDWAYGQGQATQDGKNLVRDMIAWAKDPKEIPEYGRSDTVNISANLTNAHLPISAEYLQYELGDAINIPINVTNYADITSDRVSFYLSDPDYEIDYVNVSVSIPANKSKIVNFVYQTTNESKIGTYFIIYLLYASETVIGGGFEGGFALGVNTTSMSTYKINFTLTDPDKNIIKQENMSAYVPPGEIEAVNFTYANPSKLGIWNLQYYILDYDNTLVDFGTKRFAVSKYTENPEGFVYQGKKISFAVSSPEERYAYGSDVPFTIHIWNREDTGRDILVKTSYQDWSLRSVPLDEVNKTLHVPAHGEATYTHTVHVGDIYLSHNQLITRAYFYEDGTSLGRTEKVIYMFSPSINIQIETDKKEYAKGEDVFVSLNLTNKRSASCNATIMVKTLDPDNNKVFEDTFNVNLGASESLNKTLNFSLPITAEYGIYLVTAEAYTDGKKTGSGSTHFELLKDYIIKVSFDRPSRAYRIRENMSIDLEITNIGSALWSSAINISIPVLAFEDSKYVSLNLNQTEKINYNLNIPETTPAGKHDVIVTIGFDNSLKKYYFVIPVSKLVISLDGTTYNVGENFPIGLMNIGGVDAVGTLTTRLRDWRWVQVDQNIINTTVGAGTSAVAEFELSSNLVGGKYTLTAKWEDVSGGTAYAEKAFTLSGLSADISVETNKQFYLKGMQPNASTTIVNRDGPIVNATLVQRLYTTGAEVFVPINITDTSTSYVVRINSSHMEIAVRRSDGHFTLGARASTDTPFFRLMYGHPSPWSSFTTVKLLTTSNDVRDLVFGSYEGFFTSPPHIEGTAIVATWEALNVSITQIIRIIYSVSGNPDTVWVGYSVENRNPDIAQVGVRVLIDTQLHYNDGAPFRIPEVGPVLYERDFAGGEVPDYWHTMDDLDDPTIVAQSTLKGGGAVTPQRFVIAYWGHAYDTIWDYTVDSSRSVTGDSAVLIFWNLIGLSSGSSTTFSTSYGIGYPELAGISPGVGFEAVFGGLIWERRTEMNIDAGSTAELTIQLPSLTIVGRHVLLTRLESSLGQPIAINTTSFYVIDKNLTVTVGMADNFYKTGEPVTIFGRAYNFEVSPANVSLRIYANSTEIYSEILSVEANSSTPYSYSTSFSEAGTCRITARVGSEAVTFINVIEPSVDVSLTAPDVVGRDPFEVSILLVNPHPVELSLTVSLDNVRTWDVLLAPQSLEMLNATMSVNEPTELVVTVTGDVFSTVSKTVVFGENARIDVTPENTYLEGTVVIPFTVTNIGLLDVEFNATFSLHSQTVSKILYLPKGQNITDNVSFNLTRGRYFLEYNSPFEDGSVIINVLSPPEYVVSSVNSIPADMTFTIGQNATITFRVRNIGGLEGEASIRLMMPDFEDINSTWIRPGAVEDLSFSFIIPDDLEEKYYKGIYELNGKKGEIRFFVQGAKIAVSASLDKTFYVEGETATLTLNVMNERNLDLSLFSRVKFNGYDNVVHFNLTGLSSKSLSFSFPVRFTGVKILYTIYTSSGRALYINAMYIYEKPPETSGITLSMDKQVYSIGDTAAIFVDVTRSGTLTLTAPNYTETALVEETAAFSFVIPELRSGTYYVDYTFDNYSSSYPFDVIGYSARIVEFTLDKEEYKPSDIATMEMTVEVNRGFSGSLSVRIYDPMENIVDSFEIDKSFTEGENKVQISRTLTSRELGIHSMVCGVYANLTGHSLVLLASGARYFDMVSGVPTDTTPPTTTLFIDSPQFIDSLGNIHVTSNTPIALTAVDNNGAGSGVINTRYRIYNSTYDSGWIIYIPPITFYITSLDDDSYSIDYYSTDNAGNVESTNTQAVILDNIGPLITVSNPPAGWALQDGVTFMGSIVDSGSGLFSMSFSIREANDGDGVPIGFEYLPASFDSSTGEWSFSFDTLLVPDGYYVLYIEAEDNLGNEASVTVPYSIRNWAVIELLPSSESNKAGRTMPVKFALRVAAEVDPDQPFVYNEELRIEIFATADPDDVLQESYYGDTARDYRVSSVHYITNFKTIKRKPMEYTVAIYKDTFDVGSFTFETVK